MKLDSKVEPIRIWTKNCKGTSMDLAQAVMETEVKVGLSVIKVLMGFRFLTAAIETMSMGESYDVVDDRFKLAVFEIFNCSSFSLRSTDALFSYPLLCSFETSSLCLLSLGVSLSSLQHLC